MATSTAVKEYGIGFKRAMVDAILAGRKTMTRRALKSKWFTLQPHGSDWRYNEYDSLPKVGRYVCGSGPFDPSDEYHQRYAAKFCPYGVPGDRLYVREMFGPCRRSGEPCRISEATYVCFPDGSQKFKNGEYYHETSGVIGPWPAGWRWQPSIFLPRWGSRILLEVVDVRLELVQDISDADVLAEGMTLDLFREMLEPMAKRQKFRFARWLRDDDSCMLYCTKCVKKAAKESGLEIDGWDSVL